jgi:PAS domain S-box-containing protein
MALDDSLAGLAEIQGDNRYRLLVDSVVDYGIYMLDTTGHVVSWNAGAERLQGYSPAEVIGSHFSAFYPPAEVAASKCERQLDIARRDGRFEEEGWRLKKDGSRFWANVVITALRDKDGRVVGFGKFTRDLTERKAAEDELRRSEERLRLLIASVKDYAIFILDATGHVASWNTGATRLKGYGAQEIIGRHFSAFYPEEDVRAGKCEWELATAIEQGRFEEEGWRLKKDGSRFWANVVITPIFEAHGGLFGFAKVTRDLTDRKRLEEERIARITAEERGRIAEESEGRSRAMAESLSAARDKAERATRLKDEFLATVSHELRTPLNAILGWGRLLQSGLPKEKTAHALDAIVRNAIAQNQIINDLLDVSRIIAGQLRLEVEQLDISQVVASAIEVIRPSAEAKELRILTTLAPDAGLIKGDAGRLQQVMWNLLSNAVKFTARGGQVHVTLERDASAVRVQVADTGKGIATEFLPHVFERFTQQEASITRGAGGLGLGLAIVKHLIELHGGSVAAHSEGLNKGATFSVWVPISAVRLSDGHPRDNDPSPAVALQNPPELEGRHVLVVDDEEDARELVRSVLESAGAKVQTAVSASQALSCISENKPDVIVSDIGMPERDGYDFIRALRELPRDRGGRIPAVALTAFARLEDRRRALAAGFQNHATKPIEPQELLFVVANLVGRFT